ncbi:hypothetical protein QCA50_011998 [Cerrena zonata]|uniref:HCP-like protein n=1 Tax=Cerrena zonata TaxID=2478898 RepID=A0AAW0FV80_9APHY
MTSHPYRQKAGAETASAPYPVDSFVDAPAAPISNETPETSSPYSFHSPLDQANQLNNKTIEDDSLINENYTNPYPNNASPYPTSAHYNPTIQNVLNNNHIKPQQSPSSSSTPYPLYDSQTPPPAFPKEASNGNGKNAKKSNDPTVLFQYAQYMLQTALILDNENSSTPGSNTPNESPRKNENLGVNNNNMKKSHSKSKSNSSSLDLENASEMDDSKLKRALLKEAVHYLRKLSDKGYTEAQYLLGDACSSGALGKVDNKEAFALFQAAAKHGHIESAYRTSYCYEEGLGTGRDARKAIEYLKMAASKNHPASMYKLGVYSFYSRMGMPNNVNTKKMGIKWLTRASNVANELIGAAPYELGKIYYNGFQDIIITDQKYALELYSQAAALGHIESAAILGKCYEVGEIVPQDSNLSIHYYTQAALGGDPESMLSMCAWYLVGNEPFLPKDELEAFEWAKRAAMCGLAKAQFALANFYEKGIGCIKNINDAQTWYQKGAENGDEKCLNRLANKELAAKLQKNLKKKKSGNLLNGNEKAAQDKDCIIM